MFFDGIILDLDNTLYNYNFLEKKCMDNLILEVERRYKINSQIFLKNLEIAKKELKHEIPNTASSHNRFIYFKKCCEKLNLKNNDVLTLNEIYWNFFLENIELNEGVLNFLIFMKKENKKIIILTDFQTEYQYKKLEKLGLLDLFDFIITSEEVGIEKPSKKMFQEVLNLTGIEREKLIMIGDNYLKDIEGCMNSNIYGLYFSDKKFTEFGKLYSHFGSFKELLDIFEEIKKELHIFVKMCNSYGKRLDLVQSGGGNISFKWKNLLCIKCSGFHMENISENFGYSLLDNEKLKSDIFLGEYKKTSEYNIFTSKKSSIETYMHSILKKYTVHLHPISIIKILSSKNGKKFISENFLDYIILDYYTPGKVLCQELLKTQYYNKKIFFLINHGIIITSEDSNEIDRILEKMLIIFKNNEITNTEFSMDNYLCRDIYINNILKNKKYLLEENFSFPDAVVFLKDKYFVEEEKIFIRGKNLKEIREIEIILKTNLMICDQEEVNFLTPEEVKFLDSWEDEKFRKK